MRFKVQMTSLTRYSESSHTAWTALRYFNLYRLVLSGLFGVLLLSKTLPPPIASFDAKLFSITAILYFALSVVLQVLVERHWPVYGLQVMAQVLIDIVIITLMMYASGGITSGFGMLLIVSIAGGSLLIGGRTAILLAAIASLAVLGEEFYRWTYLYFPVVNYTHSGFLGATFFATALVAYIFGKRVRESEALASQRALDLENLSRLNEHIILRMQAGVAVLDTNGRLRLLNAAAGQLLGIPQSATGRPLGDLAPDLHKRYRQWLADTQNTPSSCQLRQGTNEIIASFSALGRDAREGTLIFLEDAAITRQRAQQLKLASLGRLTASIAHEIRNPLGAISHASQLLSESPERRLDDLRLTRIIKEHSDRVNAIIENILQIGRRDVTIAESFELKPWLEGFCEELASRSALEPDDIRLAVVPETILVRMDKGQLRQILWNLCENGLRHSKTKPRLEISAGNDPASQRPYLDVRDRGSGISAEAADQIFEPFFTTDSKGTGLGLYIAGELCESNQASLSLHENSERGCVFRIQFAHPDRQQLSA